MLYYHGQDIYQFILSNLNNRDPGTGSNPDGSTGSTSLSASINQENIPSGLNNLPSQSKIITYFSERAKRPTAYDFMGTFPHNASGKRPDFINFE